MFNYFVFIKSIKKVVVAGNCGTGTDGLVIECGTEMSSETEICRSSRESLTHMGAESYDLSPLNQSLLQANDELTILRPREEISSCLK